VGRDLEIVYVLVPVLANIVCGCGRRRRHGAYYKIKVRMKASLRLSHSSAQARLDAGRWEQTDTNLLQTCYAST
jgi:hypothetical protein